MDEMTRRAVLTKAPAAGLAALITALPGESVAGKEPAAREELFVLGPFPLGDWFKARPDKKSPFLVGTGPSYDEIVESLNECRVYLIDQRVESNSGKVDFGDRGYPRVALEGKLFHSWKVDGKDFTIQFPGAKSLALTTDYSRSPAVRTVAGIEVTFRFEGENWLAKGTSVQNHHLRKPVTYDITGKRLPG
jgi:hypothetical protein